LLGRGLGISSKRRVAASARTNPSKELGRLRANKQRFVQQILDGLFGRAPLIPLSDFFSKSLTLDQNIRTVLDGYNDFVDEKEISGALKEHRVESEEWVGGLTRSEEIAAELHHYANFKLFKDYWVKAGLITDVLKKKQYNCSSSTQILSCLADQRINKDDFGIVLLDSNPEKDLPGHVFSWVRGADGRAWGIENTNGAPPRLNPSFRGLPVPAQIYLTAYLLYNGYKLSQLPKYYQQFYKKGIDSGGMPIAGEMNTWSVPDEIVPNKYFGVRDPEPVKRTENLPVGNEENKVSNTKLTLVDVIKFARADNSVFEWLKIVPPLRKGLVNLVSTPPANIDWKLIAEDILKYRNTEIFTGDRPEVKFKLPFWAQGVVSEYEYYVQVIESIQLLSRLGHKQFSGTTVDSEFARFEAISKDLLDKKEGVDWSDFRVAMPRALLKPRQGLRIFNELYSKGLVPAVMNSEDFYEIFGILRTNMPFADLVRDFKRYFRKEYDYEFFICNLKALASHKSRHKYLKNLLLWAREKAKNDAPGYHRMTREVGFALAELGYGMEALELAGFFNPLDGQRDDIYRKIYRLHPLGATGKDIRRVKEIIKHNLSRGKLWDETASLIYALAVEGEMVLARKFIKKMHWALNKRSKRKGKPIVDILTEGMFNYPSEIISTIGKINCPETRRLLFEIFEADQESVVDVGSVFADHKLHNPRIISGLRRALIGGSRQAAYVLIRMGEL